jgi:hypothetical protein
MGKVGRWRAMAESAFVQKVSIKHDVILDYLVANPTAKRTEVAAIFGVTPAWLSTIIHSCAFQERLRLRQDELFTSAVVQPIQDKLMGVAQIATERLMEVVQYESDPKVLSQVADTALKNLGYGQKVVGVPVNQQNNITFNVTKEELAGARALIGRVQTVSVSDGLLESPAALESVYTPSLEYTKDEG